MKHKKLGIFVFVCFVSWIAFILFIFNDYSPKIPSENKNGALSNYIKQLESKISQQEKVYKDMYEKFEELKKNPKVISQESALELQRAFEKMNGETFDANSDSQFKILDKDEPILPIIVFSCNRPSVRRCLDGLLKYRPDPEKFPIIVSQDCAHSATAKVIQSYGDQVIHIQQPDQSEPEVPAKELKFKGYFKISRHYRWGLKQIFRTFNHTAVIIVEDDLDVAPDFYEYFSSTYDLLKNDPTLWCVSAWNDNGKANLIDSSHGELLYRSDFFPGLGWMITKSLWDELESKWPNSYWDDWMRRPEQRKERACIRPEISRTRTYGKIGVSNGMFFDKHLKFIKLNENPVAFSKTNMSYLLKEPYDKQFHALVDSLPVVSAADVKSNRVVYDGPVRVIYHTRDGFKSMAKLLGLMDDLKSGVPRTGYHGIIPFYYNSRRVYLAPNSNWKGYDLTWS